MQKKTLLSGIVFVFIYCLATAGTSVLVNVAERLLSGLLLSFYSFVICMLLYLALTSKNLRGLYLKSKNSFSLVVKLNIVTAILWFGTFYSLVYLSPAIVSSIFFGLVPLFTLLFTFKNLATKKEKIFDFIASALFVVLLCGLMLIDLAHSVITSQMIYALILAIFATATGALNNIYAHELLSVKDFSSTEILAVRFIFFIVLSLVMILIEGISFSLDYVGWGYVVLVAILSVSLPMFCIQEGLKRIGPLFVAYLVAFVPVLSYFLEMLEPYYHFSWSEFSLVSLLSLLIIATTLLKGKYIKCH